MFEWNVKPLTVFQLVQALQFRKSWLVRVDLNLTTTTVDYPREAFLSDNN